MKDKLWNELSGILVSWLYASGMAMMLVYFNDSFPNPLYVFGYTLLAAVAMMVLSLGKKSKYLTVTALIIAALVYILAGHNPIAAVKEFIAAYRANAIEGYIDVIALILSISAFLIAYSLTDDRHGVYVLFAFTLIVSAISWFVGHRLRMEYAIAPILALSTQFSVSGHLKQSNIKALLSASLIAAILATAIVPSEGVTLQPLETASERMIRAITEFFNLDRDDVAERRTFNLISYGWRSLFDAFGGPARPNDREALKVNAEETLYLRGAIRYTYDGRGWTDENNIDKAGKIKRYMTTGIEGRVYRGEYEMALDLNKTRALNEYFSLKTAQVEILSDNEYWSIYTPNRTVSVEADDDIRVYYNNIGEIFASSGLTAGDKYTISYYSFDGDDEQALRNAVNACYNDNDSAYQAALLLNMDVPAGVDNRLFRLVSSIISDSSDQYGQAMAIRDYLRSRGTYTLNARYVPSGQDFVSYFVLSDMNGYCMHFAAAMTLMARIAGLPARYVEGYLAEIDENGECIVTGRQAHAWCEVYFKGFGWVTFEATPGYSESTERTSDGSEAQDSFGNNLGDNSQNPPEPTPSPAPTSEYENWEEPEDDEDDTQFPEDDAQQDLTGEDEGAQGDDTEESDGGEDDAGEDDAGGDSEDEDNSDDNTDDNPEGQNDDPLDASSDDWSDSAPDGESSNAPQNDSQNSKGSAALWITLGIILVLAATAAFVIIRLKRTNPVYAQLKYKTDTDKMLLWYRACLAALEIQGLSLNQGYTPASFAQKAAEMGLADKAFVSFSALIAMSRYSERRIGALDTSAFQAAYEGIKKRMKLSARLRWYLNRVKNDLGSIDTIP